ncbi:fatty acid desaturase family protein [Blattabacterium cuenoti]|uniref:fatty acid desaturase family protein n=1 Tax=Blattabacterium cuenoti TaxID=1653831 RepID=UPI001EEA6FA4|nr:fatty acid desaturase [Blattabacterium cuenoti]
MVSKIMYGNDHHKKTIKTQHLEIKQTFKNWKKIVKYYSPNNYKAFIQIMNTFIPFFIIWIIIKFYIFNYSKSLTILSSIFNSFFLIRIFIIQHDCGHQSFTTSKSFNNVLGFICSLFTLIPFKYWAKSHNYHHAHNSQLDFRDIGDIRILTVREYHQLSFWKKIKYRMYRSFVIMFFLGPIYYILIHNRLPLIHIKGWEKEKFDLWISNLCLLFFYAFIGFFIGFLKLLFIQLPIVVFFSIVAVWVFYVQHQHNPNYKEWKVNWDYCIAAIKGSSFYKLPKIVHWFTGNIGYHHIHHLAPHIPFYYLQDCHRQNPIFDKYVTKMNFSGSLKCIRYKLWDEENKKMISFNENEKKWDKNKNRYDKKN